MEPLRQPSLIERDQIEHNFTYHAPNEQARLRLETIRDDFKRLAHKVCASAPHSRELSLAITKLEEANMWCNAAIVRDTIE